MHMDHVINVAIMQNKIAFLPVGASTSFGPLVKDCLTSLVSRKLSISKSLLIIDIKALFSSLKKSKLREEFCKIAPQFDKINASYSKFRKALHEVTDVEFAFELSNSVTDLFEKCSNLHEICQQRYF